MATISQSSRKLTAEIHGGHEAFIHKLKLLKFSAKDIDLIDHAYDLAKAAHRGIDREGGDRYFEHIRAVCNILLDEAKVRDPRVIIAAILHDVVEDTGLFGSKAVAGKKIRQVSQNRIQGYFGKVVAKVVLSLTKPGNKKDYPAYIAGILKTGSSAVLIKMADRLHNLRTLRDTSRSKQRRKIAETENNYMPMFERSAAQRSTSRPSKQILLAKIKFEVRTLKAA